jgi:hypothetical protein
VCRRQKTEKRLFNISLFIYNFATYAHLTNACFPTPTRASLRGQMQTALATVANVISLVSFPREPNHLPRIRRPGILTLQSGLRVLFSVVSSTPNLARVPDRTLAQAVEA